MKIALIVARYLLGLMFTVTLDLNGFLHFLSTSRHRASPGGNPSSLLPSALYRTSPRSSSKRCRSLVGCCCSSGFFVPLAR